MCGPGNGNGHGGPAPGAPDLVEGTWHLRGRVLPTGELRDVYVVDGRISFEPIPGATTVAQGGWILPGLVDAHAHLALASPAGNDATEEERVESSARAQLGAGVLLVREPGSPGHSSTGVGPARGLPRTITAGRFLAPPGGYFPGLAREVAAADLPAAVAEEARAGSGWVKLIGDFPADDGLAPNWTPAAMAIAVAAAHGAGVRITVHAVLPETIAAAVDAGIDGVEHGTGMPHDLLAVLAARDISWVPTMLISDSVRGLVREVMTPAKVACVDAWLDQLPATVADAASAGVRLLAGTDAGMVPHGMVAAEVGLLVRAGVPADMAVGAASWGARSYFGLPGIEQGAPADLIVVGDDPRVHPDALNRVGAMVLDGRLVTTASGGRRDIHRTAIYARS